MSGFPVVNGVTVFELPPPGIIPDFNNPRRQHLWLAHYLVFAIGGFLAFLAICQRLYTKLFLTKHRSLQIDDYLMLIGWGMSIATQAILVRSIAVFGLCVHVWEMPLTRFERYSVDIYIAAPIYQMCNGFTKLSLLTVYLRLSPQKWFRIGAWFSIVVVALYTSIITLIMFFHCSPINRAYDFKIMSGHCLDAGSLYIATAGANIATDLMLFLLPTPMVLKLKMGKAQKIACILIFAIGSLTIATSCIRLVYLPRTLNSTDLSWDAAPANIWTFVEGNLFVICGSIPTMRRFFAYAFPRIFHTSLSTSNDRSWSQQLRQDSQQSTQDSQQRTQDSQQRTQDSQQRTQDSQLSTQNSQLSTQESQKRIQESQQRTQNSQLHTQDSQLSTQDSQQHPQDSHS
ncbi:hypothetical protein VE02_09654 [Pseudogymnoascus sp. 03VT05]|nr:hypothetical protein VE02_09654 [Pseudogymnoascus sp. 03VT05]